MDYTVGKFQEDVEKIAKYFSAGNIKSIAGIPRGGIPLAIALSQRLNLPLVDINMINRKTLICDDIIDSGKTLAKYWDAYFTTVLCSVNTYQAKKVRYCARITEKKDEWVDFFWEKKNETVEDNVLRCIQYLGENPEREGLIETPQRVVKSWNKIYGGYKQDPKNIIKTFSKINNNSMIMLKNIEFYSTCEHHLLPFFGKAHIGYIPNEKIVGISKLARLLEVFARRMQIQERIGEQITDILMSELGAQGAICVLEAQHFCMTSRGVEKQNSIMVTSSIKGNFENSTTRQEFMNLIRG